MINSIQALANYSQQQQYNQFQKTNAVQVGLSQRAVPVDVVSLSGKAESLLADSNSIYLDLSKTLEDIRRQGGSEFESLNAFDDRIATDQYVTLTKISDRQVQISISSPGGGQAAPNTFDVYLNENGTIRGFDTAGTGGVNTIQAPQLNIVNGDGSETNVQLTFSGVTGASSVGLMSSEAFVTHLQDRQQIDANTAQAFLAYANAATVSDSDSPLSGTSDGSGETVNEGMTDSDVKSPPGQSSEPKGNAYGRNK